jgi:thiamine biosynthesis lipoprotein
MRTAIVILLTAFLLLAGSLATQAASGNALKRLDYQQILMGVPIRISVYAADESLANAAVHAAFDRVRALNLIFSDYDDDSEISRLCRTSAPDHPVPVSPELAKVLALALDLSRRTCGAFDVTVGPLTQLWRKARRTKRLPSPATLAAARDRVDYRFVRLDVPKQSVALLKPGMRLDFGGIVKGYAADEARTMLRSRGLPIALVALEGDISAGDAPPDHSGWRIGIQGIGTPETSPDRFITLRNCAVSTAGDNAQFVEIGGVRYAHIVNPRTGLGLTHRVSATVIAPAGILADGLDTAACILGSADGAKLIEGTPGASGRIVEATADGNNRVVETVGFSKFLIRK